MTRELTVTLEPDDQGMIGRECPKENCGLYFKLRLGTGWDTETISCPYCRAEGHIGEFHTEDQLEYARSVAARDLLSPLLKAFKRDVVRMHHHRPRGLIQLRFSVDYC